MTMKKKAAALLLAALMLTACGGPVPPASSTVKQGGGELGSSSRQEASGAPAGETENGFYRSRGMLTPEQRDIPAGYGWNPDGTFTFQNENTINTLSPENQLLETVTIPVEQLTKGSGYQFSWSDTYILAVAADYGAGGMVYFTDDGGVHLANVTLFDRKGQLVRQYPAGKIYDDESGGYLLPAPEGTAVTDGCSLYTGGESPVYWLDSTTAVINGHSHVVFYDFAADTGRVLDDMSDLKEKHGKFFVYYGVYASQCGVAGGSFYYTTRRTEEEGIHGGTVWRADKNGAVELFDGKKVSHLFVGSNGLVMSCEMEPDDPESGRKIYYAAPGENSLRGVDMGNVSVFFRECGKYLAFMHTFGKEDTVLYAYRFDTGELSNHSLGQVVQVDDLWLRQVDGSLRYYYTTFVDGATADWVYDTASDTTTQLPEGTVGSIFSVSPDGDRVLRWKDRLDPSWLRVGQWEG